MFRAGTRTEDLPEYKPTASLVTDVDTGARQVFIALQYAIPAACLRDQKADNLVCFSDFEDEIESTPLF